MIPTVMHIHLNGVGAFCGVKRVGWPEECMSDEFARTLPICPECLKEKDIHYEVFKDLGIQGIEGTATEPIVDDITKELYLIKWREYE